MCDLCIPEIGDHDRPYQFGRRDLMLLRLTRIEVHRLEFLRNHVADVRAGYRYGPAYGDIARDPRDITRGSY